MSTTYGKLVAEVALHVGALKAAQSFVQEGLYTTAPLTLAEIDSDSPYSLTAIQDAVLQAEADFAWAIALAGNHPWRSSIRGVTASLANNAVLPTVDSNTKPVIGSWGTVYDASDNTPCVEMPLDVIVRRVRNSNTNYLCPVYYYKFDGNLIRHTRTTVVVECCVYDRATQVTAMNANGAMLLPDALVGVIVAHAVGNLRTDKIGEENQKIASIALQAIQSGFTSVQAKSVPVGITNKAAN